MTSDPNDPTQPYFDLPSVDAAGACTCCGWLPPTEARGHSTWERWIHGAPSTWLEPTGDEAPCTCLGDDCPDCGACLLAHCQCDPGALDEDQMSPAPRAEGD